LQEVYRIAHGKNIHAIASSQEAIIRCDESIRISRLCKRQVQCIELTESIHCEIPGSAGDLRCGLDTLRRNLKQKQSVCAMQWIGIAKDFCLYRGTGQPEQISNSSLR
jgi:hypothetical protein